MNARLLKSAGLVSAIPFVSMLLVFRFWGRGAMPLEFALLGALTQIMALLRCRRELEPLFRPALEVLTHMGVAPVPAPYQPGRFRADFRICSALMWVGVPAPLLCLLARAWTGGPGMARSVGPSMTLLIVLLVSFGLILLGALSLALWVKFGQAVVIANEKSERKRYLFRGFAEEVYRPDRCTRYRAMNKLNT